MSQALYRKYRSSTLGEIVGQNHITSVLQKSLETNSLSHAYLFTGPRGVGKTSVARILAGLLTETNPKETSLDIIEIDAASNNSVEDIRDLRDKAQIAPASSPKKVYIIDEVHMLSRSAFNALLKTLEEPPAHVVFILATTNPDKLPETIISRTQHFAFRKFSDIVISDQLKMIAKKEKITIDEDALNLIVLQADGGMRDAISLLDQLSPLGKEKNSLTVEVIANALGLAQQTTVATLLDMTLDGDFINLRKTLVQLEAEGVPAAILLDQLIDEALKQSFTRQELLPLLENLSLLNKRDDYLDVKLLTTLALFNPKKSSHETITKNEAKPAKQPTKTVSLATTAPKIVQETIVEKKHTTSGAVGKLDWNIVIDNTKKKHMALASLVVKCKHEMPDDSKLILYTMNKFNKKKLDDPKYLPHLYTILGELGFNHLVIETVASAPPPKNKLAKDIAKIMGGAEVVEVDI